MTSYIPTHMNDYRSKVSEHLPHLTQLPVSVHDENMETCSLSSFQVYDTVLLTTITVLHIKCPEHLHLIIGTVFLFKK